MFILIFREYRLMDRGHDCIVEWPLQYMYQYKTYNGWMRPISHEIVHEPTPIPCPARSFYFDVGSDSILLGNRTFKQNLPFIPSLEYGTEQLENEPKYNAIQGVYTPEEISDFSVHYELQKNLRENTETERIIRMKIEGKTLTQEQESHWLKYLQEVWSGICGFFSFGWFKTVYYCIGKYINRNFILCDFYV